MNAKSLMARIQWLEAGSTSSKWYSAVASRLIPFQNLSYLRGLFDQAQKGT